MTMTSNAYIATDSETLMKVGKSNDVKRRERELAIPITFTIACFDESTAFRVESELRDFVLQRGGIRHQATIDWFKFDAQIYRMLYEFATNMGGQGVVERELDEEIEELVTRYYQLLFHELTIENQRLHEELRELKEAERQLREAKRELPKPYRESWRQYNAEIERINEEYQSKMEQILKEAARREGELREQIGELKGMLCMY
jgi:hypothetical protein